MVSPKDWYTWEEQTKRYVELAAATNDPREARQAIKKLRKLVYQADEKTMDELFNNG